MSHFYRFFVFLLVFSFASAGWAKPQKPKDLQGYIEKNCRRSCVNGHTLNTAVKRMARKYRVDNYIILAIVRVESAFNVKAKGGDAVGLTQVMPRYHRTKFTGTNYYHVDDNIAVGTQVYKACQDRMHGNVSRSLRCYNGGGDSHYALKVMRAYSEIKRLQLES